MACLLKIPNNESKGVVTFTTQEQRVIAQEVQLRSALHALRLKYVIGLHLNWHDYQFKPDPAFDFFMAGEGDLRTVNDEPFRSFPIDACNFTPAIYTPNTAEKFWDILIVGNPVFFKRPEVVLRTIRKLFDESERRYRVLYICPIPEYRFSDENTAFYDVRGYYEALFTREERNWFTLLTTTFNSPFPFDRETLSVFFHNSKVFLHCATEERRCRIAAYAWCAGLPVVAYPSVASILPTNLQQEPGYFKVENDDDYAKKIISALHAASNFDPQPYRKELSETFMKANLDKRLAAVFDEMGLPYQHGNLLDKNLDMRLGWHHHGIGGVSNGLMQPLDKFMETLQNLTEKSTDYISILDAVEYPERALSGESGEGFIGNIEEVEKKSIYLNPRKLWFRIYRAIIHRLKFH